MAVVKMMSEKGMKTVSEDPEVTDVARITTGNEESHEATSTLPVKSNIRGCLQVLGAFFIFFNVWFVNFL